MSPRLQLILQYAAGIALIILLNLVLGGWFVRVDLTREKRYSLNEVTLETAASLEVPMFATVYLEGEFPPDIRNYQEALRTTLMEITRYSGGEFDFAFADPSKNQELIRGFQQKGYAPIPVQLRVSATETRQQYMWPLVLMRYRSRELYIDLLKGASVMTPRGPNVDFAKAEADLEYKLVSAMRKLLRERGGIVALMQGHGEPTVEEMGELITEIQNSYSLYSFDQAQNPGMSLSPSIDVLLIANPKTAFSERDKYVIDQYLMMGGSILWMLNQEVVDLDMYRKQATLTELRDLNLDDMFMKYGFKLNYDLIQDLESESIELFQDGPSGGNFVSKKWVFYPLVLGFPDHPINRNIDAILLRYPSSIDSFHLPGVRKSVFLQTSRLSRTIQGKQFIEVSQYVSKPPPRALFNTGSKITGLLVEGPFESLFAGRSVPVDSATPMPPTAPTVTSTRVRKEGESDEDYRARLAESIEDPDLLDKLAGLTDDRAMVIFSDAELGLGNTFRGERQYLPYDNKSLIMNAIDYLAGDEALTRIRSKEVIVRRLSKEKVIKYAGGIRVLNLLLPLLAIILFGIIRGYLRRRKNLRLRSLNDPSAPNPEK